MLVNGEPLSARTRRARGRAGEIGVLWPNNRDVDELAPWSR